MDTNSCELYPALRNNCKYSCNVNNCKSICKDSNGSSCYIANGGLCKLSPSLRKNCPKSCGICGSNISGIQAILIHIFVLLLSRLIFWIIQAKLWKYRIYLINGLLFLCFIFSFALYTLLFILRQLNDFFALFFWLILWLRSLHTIFLVNIAWVATFRII